MGWEIKWWTSFVISGFCFKSESLPKSSDKVQTKKEIKNFPGNPLSRVILLFKYLKEKQSREENVPRINCRETSLANFTIFLLQLLRQFVFWLITRFIFLNFYRIFYFLSYFSLNNFSFWVKQQMLHSVCDYKFTRYFVFWVFEKFNFRDLLLKSNKNFSLFAAFSFRDFFFI